MKRTNIDGTLVLLTPKETARRLSISTRALRCQVDNGKFPAPRWIGGVMRFLASDLVAYANDLPMAEIDRRGFPDEEKSKRETPEAIARCEERIREQMKANEPQRLAVEAAERLLTAQIREEEEFIERYAERRRSRDPKAPLPLP